MSMEVHVNGRSVQDRHYKMMILAVEEDAMVIVAA
jgi:hypothetical protein